MPYDYDKRLLFYKIEAAEGTAETPAAADAIVTRGLTPVNYEADTRTRELDGQYFGARPQTKNQLRGRTSFEVELTGAGGLATAVPAWMKLLRIAGMNAGTVGASSVVQQPISAAIPSATLWDYTDTMRQPLIGARADFRMVFEDDQYPYAALDVMGYAPSAGSPAVNAVPATPDITAFKTPQFVSNDNSVFSFDGYAAELRRLELVAGSVLTPRSFVGAADRVKYRNREWSGTAVIRCPTLTAKDYFAQMRSGVVALTLTHGLGVGNIVEIAAPRCELGVFSASDEEGDLMLSIPFRLLPTTGTGNDEITITTK